MILEINILLNSHTITFDNVCDNIIKNNDNKRNSMTEKKQASKRQAPISIVRRPQSQNQSIYSQDTLAQAYLTQAKDLWKQIDWKFWTRHFLVGLNLVTWGSYYLTRHIEDDPDDITYSSMALNSIVLNTALFCSLGSAYRQWRVTDIKARACILLSELITNQGDIQTQQNYIGKFLTQTPCHQDMQFLSAEFAQTLLAHILLTVPKDDKALNQNEIGQSYHLVNDLLTYFQLDETISNHQMVDKKGAAFSQEETKATLKDRLTKLSNKYKHVGKLNISQKPFYIASQKFLEGQNQNPQKTEANDLFSMARERLYQVPSLSDVIQEGANYLTSYFEQDKAQAGKTSEPKCN